MRLQLTLPFIKNNLHVLLKTTPKRDEFHYGIGNRTEDAKYLVFLDYDNTPIEWIHQEIDLLQDHTQVGTAYIFQTKNGHHVLFLEKFLFHEMLSIMNMTSIDQRYKNVPLRYGQKIWVLRNSKKRNERIKYLGYKYKESPVEKSNAHAMYLVEVVGMPLSHVTQVQGAFDKKTEIVLGYYKTPPT